MTIENKLAELRERWRREPENRSTIEKQVKVLKLGSKYPEYIPVKEDKFVSSVKEALS